ncbi:unnamed protein product [Alternaria alternata]
MSSKKSPGFASGASWQWTGAFGNSNAKIRRKEYQLITQQNNTALPSDLCDKILLSGVETPMAEHLVACRRVSIFVQIIKYRLLCGDIIETLHNQGRKNLPDDELRHRRDQFAADLKTWRLNVERVVPPSSANRRQLGGLLNKNPSTMEVISDTRTCSNILVAVSERWKSLQRCVDIFNRLSDAILIDVIKFSTTPINATHLPTNDSGNRDEQYRDRSELAAETNSNDLVQHPQWNHASYLQPMGTDRVVSSLSPLAIENEFRGSAFDLQQMYDQQQVDMSVYRFSQAWFDSFDFYGGIGPQLNDITMGTHL